MPSRVLVYFMALYDRIISSSKLIHKSLYGNHIHRRVIMSVIYVAPSWRGSGLGVSHSVKLNPSWWNFGGQRGIRHNKCVFWNRYGGRGDKGWNIGSDLSAWLSTPLRSIETTIRPRRKRRSTSNCRIRLGNMSSTKWERIIRRSHAPRSKTRIHISRCNEGWELWRHVGYTKRKGIRDQRYWLRIVTWRAKKRSERVCSYGLSGTHWLGSSRGEDLRHPNLQGRGSWRDPTNHKRYRSWGTPHDVLVWLSTHN